ncbi:hypothetical protein [Paenibacillus sp. CAA11]|uniref:hypothetical protein n=1 Tax=Paenibacillus sp. CAA11 TaxID=1532905 RepID=UPI00131F1422|nr:hypothetical protein [Paenibacillus sp. CAA11]
MRQQVVLSPYVGSDPDYGDPIYGPDIVLKCRFDEGVKLVRNQRGEEVVSNGSFLFNKLVSVGFDDKLTFTNELGTVTTYKPLSIGVIRDIVGKPLLTEVDV